MLKSFHKAISNKIILLFLLTFNVINNCVTLVYNLRIRRTFNIQGISPAFGQNKSRSIFTALPIFSKRDRNISEDLLGVNVCERSVLGGSLLNFRHFSSKKWWFEATTGLLNENVKVNGTNNFNISRFGFDDIVLNAGYNFNINKKTTFILYGLAGFPTKTKVSLLEERNTLVGTRFYSLAIGSELSFSFINNLKKSVSLIFQNRFLHFFNRRWDPILPPQAKIQPGNLTDILFAAQFRHKLTIFETGYNATFFTNQGVILPAGFIEGRKFTRQSIYFNFSHLLKKYLQSKIKLLLGTGFSLAKTDIFNTRQFNYWLNFSLIF